MSGSTMYFRVSCTLSPTVLYILPHNFTMVSPLSRQLNTMMRKEREREHKKRSKIYVAREFSDKYEFALQQCLNCGYMNTCFKSGELILIPFAQELLTTFETLLYFKYPIISVIKNLTLCTFFISNLLNQLFVYQNPFIKTLGDSLRVQILS